MILCAHIILYIFSAFMFIVAVMSFLKPQFVMGKLELFASTNLINISEAVLMVVVGSAFMASSFATTMSNVTLMLGGAFTFIGLMILVIPRAIHRRYGLILVQLMKPYPRLLGVSGFLFCGFVLYVVS